jgi:hypothetical protein
MAEWVRALTFMTFGGFIVFFGWLFLFNSEQGLKLLRGISQSQSPGQEYGSSPEDSMRVEHRILALVMVVSGLVLFGVTAAIFWMRTHLAEGSLPINPPSASGWLYFVISLLLAVYLIRWPYGIARWSVRKHIAKKDYLDKLARERISIQLSGIQLAAAAIILIASSFD